MCLKLPGASKWNWAPSNSLSTLAAAEDGPAKVFAGVSRFDTKPKRRLHEVLRSQGVLPRQQVTCLSDGGDTVRELPAYLHPHSEHIVDWFHIAMRVEQLLQTARGFRGTDD